MLTRDLFAVANLLTSCRYTYTTAAIALQSTRPNKAYSEQCVQVHRTLISQESHSHRIAPTVADVHSTAQLPPSSVRTVYERQLNPANWTECFLSLLFRLETDRRDGRTQGHFTVGMFFVVLFSI